ncbi:mfs general substrate transporter [Stemphylium lycopersici]|uniref:Mfs general substrate transporter n=1 Tax=Stemphylium lycopersici TaxID=183478 RepID=A0A364N385_STELY|nr:mfs general substrate transporter [Stemphylium lycopersici]RAR10583.1 mfs general substrate transporter [Stemphylium lycopersici]
MNISPNPGLATSDVGVSAWIRIMQDMWEDKGESESTVKIPKRTSKVSGRDDSFARNTTAVHDMQQRETSDSDDDLEVDFAKAALSTGNEAFEVQEWSEADSLLQEALRILRQLSKQRRAFCDIFSLHYKLAICAFHTQHPVDAEAALNSLLQQATVSDEQRECVHNATHVLSQLYVRMGQIGRARAECEKALQARRKLLGKQHAASLESLALMAHIYVLLNNRALAKSCLAMIPEASRDTILRIVEVSLGSDVEHLDFTSLLSRVASPEGSATTERTYSRLSESTLEVPLGFHGSDKGSIMRSPPASPWQTSQSLTVDEMPPTDSRSLSTTSPTSALATTEWRRSENTPVPAYAPSPTKAESNFSDVHRPDLSERLDTKPLSRKEMLTKVGCHPRDRTEEAVCDGDNTALATILGKKKGFWRSNIPLFGEDEMARRLIEANYSVNEVPFGYSTNLTPLNFAIGARQVNMVSLLIAHGAVPAEPDSWSTLAGQLMSRSWLMKTTSDAERPTVPHRIMAIMEILLRRGWDINAPIAKSGSTVLHQAVSFWTGALKWDLNLRSTMTSFLCERGANPFQANAEGKTPYEMAAASEHQDLVSILQNCLRQRDLIGTPAMPVELPGQSR